MSNQLEDAREQFNASNKLIIEDSFITEDQSQKIHKTLTDCFFPWYYQENTARLKRKEFYFQFAHVFFEHDKINSNYFELLDPILSKIKMKKLRRIKANLTTMHHEVRPLKAHIDYMDTSKKARTGIYYVNTNNGCTIFPKIKKEIKSKANRFVSFPVNTQHTGTTHTDEKIRLVINFNYFI